jgi:hypothetical protein
VFGNYDFTAPNRRCLAGNCRGSFKYELWNPQAWTGASCRSRHYHENSVSTSQDSMQWEWMVVKRGPGMKTFPWNGRKHNRSTVNIIWLFPVAAWGPECTISFCCNADHYATCWSYIFLQNLAQHCECVIRITELRHMVRFRQKSLKQSQMQFYLYGSRHIGNVTRASSGATKRQGGS